MRVWLVQVGEELPIDPGAPRMWRTCLVAQQLAARGHEVTYWSGSFNHQQKLQRTTQNLLMDGPGYHFQMLYGRPYGSNISIARILSHLDNARAFRRVVGQHPRPDVILCGFPLIELAAAVSDFAVRESIPYALDGRDMWPEIFRNHIPKLVRPLATPLLAKWEKMRQRTFEKADAITGLSDSFVNWGLNIAGRAPGPLDRSFHLAISATDVPAPQIAEAETKWQALLGPVDPQVLTICFAGTMTNRGDFDTILDAIIALPESLQNRVRLVLCGDGDARERLAHRAARYSGLHVPGWQNAASLRALMRRSDAGLLPYPNTVDFLASYPNKVGEYLASGLPIITGLGGITRSLLDECGTLLAYEHRNAKSLSEALARWLNDLPSLRARKTSARSAFENHFNPETIYPAFADWIESLSKVTAHAK